MPFIAQALEEFLPGGSGGTGSEGRADAGRVEIVPGAAKFSAKEELSAGKFCHAVTGGGSVRPFTILKSKLRVRFSSKPELLPTECRWVARISSKT
jgi:hypothetical protein